MNIINMIKTKNVVISCGDRWMDWSDGDWVVYELKYRQRSATVLIQTDNEDVAVRWLLDE